MFSRPIRETCGWFASQQVAGCHVIQNRIRYDNSKGQAERLLIWLCDENAMNS